MKQKKNNLEICAKSGVLPMRIGDDETGELIEVIICSSISGGARFYNSMPLGVSLTRILKDGTEITARYQQVLDT